MSSPLVAAFTRITAAWRDPPMIVTVSRNPVEELFAHVFGAERAFNLLTREDGNAVLRSAVGPPAPVPAAAFRPLSHVGEDLLARAGEGLILRIVDPAALALIERECPALVDRCPAVWLEMGLARDSANSRVTLEAHGFRHAQTVEPHPGTLLGRGMIPKEPVPDYRARTRGQLRKLVLLDNNLTGDRGHYLSLATRIAEGARAAGVDMVWGTHRRFDPGAAPDGVQIAPVFPRSIFDLPLEEHEGADFSDEILAGWRQLAALHPEPTTHFLVPTLDGHFVRAAHRLMREDLGVPGVIHLSTPYETRHMPARNVGREVDWYLRELTQLAMFGSRLFLWTETEALASLYRVRLSGDIRALPLPAASFDDQAGERRAGEPIVFTFLGEARIDKGFLALPAIADSMLDACAPGEIEIRILHSAPFGGFSPEMENVRGELSERYGVVLQEGVLSERAYARALGESDAILLPYHTDYYRARGSGILTEALSSGCIVLGSANTVVEEYREDGVVFPCATTNDWADAVRTIVTDIAAMREASERRAVIFRSRFAARGMIDRLAFRLGLT
jgi:glycosyltransferase involved in cell wall biosynthesis